MTSLAYGLSGAEEGLYREDLTFIDREGNLSPQARRVLTDTDRLANRAVGDVLARSGLDSSVPNVPYIVDPTLKPSETSIVNGYTHGNDLGVNPHIIPGSNLFYKYSRRLANSSNPFAKYIYGKLQKPVTHLLETIVHEKLHIATQFKKRQKSDGSVTNFLSDLYGATTQYFREKLPRPLKPFSEYLAQSVFMPLAEGLNQAATYQALGMKDNRQIKAAASQEPTSYGRYTELAADSLDEIGIGSPGQFYRNYFRDGCNAAEKYVGGFFKALGRYMSAQQPQAAYATA